MCPSCFFPRTPDNFELLPDLNLPLDVLRALPPHRCSGQHTNMFSRLVPRMDARPALPLVQPSFRSSLSSSSCGFSDLAQPPPSCLPHRLAAAFDVCFVFISAAFASSLLWDTTPRTTCQGERPHNKPDFSSSGLTPAESAAASRRRRKGCTQDGLESHMGGRRVGARSGGGTTESFDARSGHDRRGDMDGLKQDSASFWSRCIFFHESTTPRCQTRETKKSNNRLSKQRNKPTNKIHRNQRPCGDDINFSQSANAIPVCSPTQQPLECELFVQPSRSAHCSCVREGSDDSRGATPRFADGNFQPVVNFVQSIECPFV